LKPAILNIPHDGTPRNQNDPIVIKRCLHVAAVERVQNIMDEKGSRRTRVQRYNWALQELLTCGHCGCALTAEIKKRKGTFIIIVPGTKEKIQRRLDAMYEDKLDDRIDQDFL